MMTGVGNAGAGVTLVLSLGIPARKIVADGQDRGAPCLPGEQVLLNNRRLASCVHAGRFSCFTGVSINRVGIPSTLLPSFCSMVLSWGYAESGL